MLGTVLSDGRTSSKLTSKCLLMKFGERAEHKTKKKKDRGRGKKRERTRTHNKRGRLLCEIRREFISGIADPGTRLASRTWPHAVRSFPSTLEGAPTQAPETL